MGEPGRLRKNMQEIVEDEREREELEIEKARAKQLSAQYHAGHQAQRDAIGERRQGAFHPLAGTIRDKEGVEDTVARRALVLIWRDKAFPLGSPAAFERDQKVYGGVKDAMVEFRGTKEGAVITEGFERGTYRLTLNDFNNVATQCYAIVPITVPTTGKVHRVQLSTLVKTATPPASLSAFIAITERPMAAKSAEALMTLLGDGKSIVHASDSEGTINVVLDGLNKVAYDVLVGPVPYQNSEDEPEVSWDMGAGAAALQAQQSKKARRLWALVILNCVVAAYPAGFEMNLSLWSQEVV
jgi:hypothetical protein